MRATRALDYKLIILLDLARKDGQLVSLRKIAEEHNLPLPFLRALARELVDEELIAGKEGKGGGYKLTRPAKEISFSEVITKDGLLIDLPCVFGGSCEIKNCNTGVVWTEARTIIQDALSKMNLEKMTHVKSLKS